CAGCVSWWGVWRGGGLRASWCSPAPLSARWAVLDPDGSAAAGAPGCARGSTPPGRPAPAGGAHRHTHTQREPLTNTHTTLNIFSDCIIYVLSVQNTHTWDV